MSGYFLFNQPHCYYHRRLCHSLHRSVFLFCIAELQNITGSALPQPRFDNLFFIEDFLMTQKKRSRADKTGSANHLFIPVS